MHQECWGGLARLALVGVLYLAVVAPLLAVAGVADEQLIGVAVGDEGDPQLVLEYGQGRPGLARLALVGVLHQAVVAPLLAVAGVADEQLIGVAVGDEGDPQLVLEYGQGRPGLARLALVGVLHQAVVAPLLAVAGVAGEQLIGVAVGDEGDPQLVLEYGQGRLGLARLPLVGVLHQTVVAPVLTVAGVTGEQLINVAV